MKNKNLKRLAVLALVCVMVMASAVAFAASYSKVYGQTLEKIRVRESASTNASIIDNIVKSACVYVTSSKTSGSQTFVQIKYRASDGSISTGWVCQNDGTDTYVKILSADQAKNQFSVSGGDLPSKAVGTFTAAQRAVSETATNSTYVRLGSSGATVKSVQTKLKALNYYTGEITGNAGEKTVAAIEAFQKKNGLTADGIAGPQTIAKIDAVYAANGGSSDSSSASSSTAAGMKLGSSGTDVRNLQADLTTLGYYWADITGNFGAKTESAVIEFQKDKGLTADGIVGAKTIAALANAIEKKGATSSSSSGSGTALKLNSKGDKVAQLQRDLETLKYYYADITGNFGSKTEAAVKAFQKDKGLTADGIAGTKTLEAIEKALTGYSGSSSSSSSSSSGATGMKLGTTSEAVRNLQKDLTTLGFYYGDITGHFGSMTEKAVEKFQKSRGLTADGVAGTKTLEAIASTLKSTGNSSASTAPNVSSSLREGDSGDAVTELQTMLKSLGYYYGDITGNFGDLTRKAVRAFQDKEDLTVDGIAGPSTLNKLRSLTGSSGSSSNESGGSSVTNEKSYGRLIKDNVNLRSAASTTSSSKASLRKGELVRITAVKTVSGMTWYYVSVKQGQYTYKGYIRSDMMETISEAEYNSAGGDSSSNYGDMETLGMIIVTGDNVALRYNPDIGAEKVGSADKGDTFYYVDSVAGWFQTKAGYWISSSYARVLKDEELKDYENTTSSTTYQLYSTGSTVQFIQTALTKLGYYTAEITGHFGTKTEAAVKAFQKANGLNNDGVVGSATLAKLSEQYYAAIGGVATGTYNATIYNISWPSNYSTIFASKLGFKRGCETATLIDIETGLSFKIYVQSTNANHADVEPLTASDTATMCRIYGVSTSSQIPWNRRAMVLSVGGYQFVCSIYGEEHGQDDKPNNNYSGQFCVHFKDSNINSGDGGSVSDDKNHQAVIAKAVDKLKTKKVTVGGVEKNIEISTSTTGIH